MDQAIISAIGNASEEYRRLSARLTEIREGIKGKESDPEAGRAIKCMDLQIRSLVSMADSMQEIAAAYRRAGRMIASEAALPELAAAYPEFGISEFGNLAEHEELIPIHVD